MSENKKKQLRNNFRVSVPKSMVQKVEIIESKKIKITLTDLSLGGCRILVKSSELFLYSLNNQINISFTFLDFHNQIFLTTVKFTEKSADEKSIIYGLQFEKLNAAEILLLQTVVFKIDRLNRAVIR